jgi:HlyD family secretion protein
MGGARKWVVRGVPAVVVAGLVALAVAPRAVEVDVAAVGRGPLEELAEGQGRTRVRERHVVSAPVQGMLRRIALRAGDPVKAGEAVATVEPALSAPLDPRTRAEAEARLRAARAMVAEAGAAVEAARLAEDQSRRDLARYETLAAAGSMAARDIEAARTEADARGKAVRQARLASETARRQVEAVQAVLVAAGNAGGAEAGGVTVAAPCDGVVLRVLQESEGPVAAGTPLMELGDPADLELVVDLPTPLAVRVKPGAVARLVRWGGPAPLQGSVRHVEPSGFTKISALGVEEQRVLVVVDPVAGGEGRQWAALGDGFRAEAAIVLWSAPDVMTVPEGAVFRHGDGWAVYVVQEGRARLRAVSIGHRDGRRAEVLGGLAEGDVVILYPGDRVSEGVRVAAGG